MTSAGQHELRALLLGRDGNMSELFMDGRYVGVADEVVALHEQSRLRSMLRRASEAANEVCGDAWFVVCGGGLRNVRGVQRQGFRKTRVRRRTRRPRGIFGFTVKFYGVCSAAACTVSQNLIMLLLYRDLRDLLDMLLISVSLTES